MKIKGGMPQIDVKATEKAIHEEMTRFVIDDALSTWVTGSPDPVPVWSGASRASFLKLASVAKTTIQITPVAPSRIPLGIETSVGDVISTPGKEYGWLWSSDLAHIGIVEDRVAFQAAGLRVLSKLKPQLPQPIFKKKK